MKSRIGKISFWALFVLIDLFVAAAVAELWIRFFIPVKNICYLSDPKMGAVFCPDQKTYGYAEKGYANVLKTNRLGFHDVERTMEKAPGVFRIIVFGDSMIQGYCVPTEQTIPSLLERFLNADNLPLRFEVLNMAPGDDGTSAQVVAYEERGRAFRPDMVLAFFMDDFPDNVMKLHGRSYSPYHELNDKGELVFVPPVPKDMTGLWERFKGGSRLYRLLSNKTLESKFYNNGKKLLTGLKIRFSQAPSGSTRKDSLELRKEVCIKESWPLTLRLLKYFGEIVKKDGGHFVVVDGQEFYDVNVGTVYSNRDFQEACTKNGLSYIAGYERYAELKKSDGSTGYFFRDHHLTPVGNREVARFIADKIVAQLRQAAILSGDKRGTR